MITIETSGGDGGLAGQARRLLAAMRKMTPEDRELILQEMEKAKVLPRTDQ